VTDASYSKMLADVGRALFTAAISSKRTDLLERMNNPRVGDLVLETTRLGPFDPDSIGRLVALEQPEQVYGRTEYGRFVVAPLHDPSREQGWQNAQFIALPEGKLRDWINS
jgi:hypothetical protein